MCRFSKVYGKVRKYALGVYKRFGFTNLLLIFLTLLVFVGFFGKSLAKIIHTATVSVVNYPRSWQMQKVGSKVYNCKIKVFKRYDKDSEHYKQCANSKLEQSYFNIDLSFMCDIEGEYVDEATQQTKYIYEEVYKYFGITYLKKRLPEDNPELSGYHDCQLVSEKSISPIKY